MQSSKFIIALIVFSTIVSTEPLIAQPSDTSPASQSLFDEIAQLDSVFFAAFNNRDVKTIEKMFAKDLEFYHDLAGLGGYDRNIESFSQLAQQDNDLRRDLVAGSLEVYPVAGHGAIEVGAHTFCHTENGEPDCGTFKFLHIWRKDDDTWKLSRVVSYGH